MIKTLRFLVTLFCVLALSLTSCKGQKKGKGQPIGTKSKKAYELFGQALLAHDIREDDKALEYLKKALKIDPRYADAWGLSGEIYLNRKSYTEAEDAIVHLLEIEPENVYALIDLGNVQFETDRYDDCIRTLNQLIALVGPSSVRDDAELKIASARFAKDAMAHPVPYHPVNLGPSINSNLEEYFPGLSTDEKTLFFTKRDGSIFYMNQNEDIYYSEKKDTAWMPAKSLGKPVNTEMNEGAFGSSPDGKQLYYASSRGGGLGRFDIWYTRKIGDVWSDPKNLGRPVNTEEWESQPAFSADGKTLYFASNRPGGYGGSDIWYSEKTDKGWSVPINMRAINTPGEEQFPFIHNDGKTLYFSSDGLPGMGKCDIYVTRKTGDKWSEPMNLGYPINTHDDQWNIVVNRTGDKAYISTDGLTDDSYGGMDIYSMDLYEGARPSPTGYVHGIVFDVDTKKRLEAHVELFDLATGKQVASATSDPVNGEFLIAIPAHSNYAFEARATGYLFHSENFELTSASLDKPFNLEIGLKKISKNTPIVLRNTFFDTDKWDLKPESRVELNLVVDFLRNNPEIRIEIGGHTDNTGNAKNNVTLSENRAKSVYTYLINQGIDAGRLTYKGYGSSVPVATNDTDEGKAKNRRTEMKIID
ncbi:MAG: PD40 domain-containing protein [Flavobacteriales bacterium]|nr:PD40 domain-containing protein [Bacteroidota bacterium]MCB9241785.1 PD40 domain-containing protein [Flavobacteriales bacterium]